MSQNIIPKDCSYGCNTRIYWSVADNAYFEVFSKQKHICKNRSKPNIQLWRTNPTTTTDLQNNLNQKCLIL